MSYQTSSKRSPPFWLLMVFWHQSEARTAATVLNWSGKTLSPGVLLAVLYFSSCHIFFRPFRLFLIRTICPWVSEDDSSYVRLFGFYTQQNVNSAANFVFTSKTGLPRRFWCYGGSQFVSEIFVSPLSEFEQHVYNSDPSPDTGSLMQLESRRAVPQDSQLP